MLTAFSESLGADLSKQWLERLFGPAFVFWAGSLLLWLGPANLAARWDALTALPVLTQSAVLIGALLVLAASDRLIETLSLYILRFLEGYWEPPLGRLALWLARLRQKGVQKARKRRSELLLKQENGLLTPVERLELARLETYLYYTPRDLDDVSATRLGDILRAAETRPRQRYGLDPVLLWPRLWLLLPESVRADLSAARLDSLAQAWLWGLLFALWSFAWPWAWVIALAWMWIAYTLTLQAAAAFCDLVLATFDTQRWRLYEALRWPLPAQSGAEEVAASEALTRFIQRGMTTTPVSWVHPQD